MTDQTLPCGHHISLERRSVESDAVWCAFCESQAMQRDAEAMELHYRQQRDAALAEAARLREALEKALPLVEKWEFAESTAFSYGDGRTEPHEWGLDVAYQQTREAMPYEQFEDGVAAFHKECADDETQTVSAEIRAALARQGG